MGIESPALPELPRSVIARAPRKVLKKHEQSEHELSRDALPRHRRSRATQNGNQQSSSTALTAQVLEKLPRQRPRPTETARRPLNLLARAEETKIS